MKNPAQYPTLVNVTYTAVICYYLITMVIGYLMFGLDVQSEVQLNLINEDGEDTTGVTHIILAVVLWLIVVIPLSKYALMMNPVNLTLENIAFKGEKNISWYDFCVALNKIVLYRWMSVKCDDDMIFYSRNYSSLSVKPVTDVFLIFRLPGHKNLAELAFVLLPPLSVVSSRSITQILKVSWRSWVPSSLSPSLLSSPSFALSHSTEIVIILIYRWVPQLLTREQKRRRRRRK
tara:strand:- start:156 stop:854 length:699 start_codon:yes stop_codon:yes gene_type:complete